MFLNKYLQNHIDKCIYVSREALVCAWHRTCALGVRVYGWYPDARKGSPDPGCPPGAVLVTQPHETRSGCSDPHGWLLDLLRTGAPAETQCSLRVCPWTPFLGRFVPWIFVEEVSAHLSRKCQSSNPCSYSPFGKKKKKWAQRALDTERYRPQASQEWNGDCSLSVAKMEKGCQHFWEGLDEDC